MASNVVAVELERIRERDGVIRASVVVEEAKPEESPIHDRFTWDDEKAANEYRLIEARQLIRSVVVVSNGRSEPIYAHVGSGASEGYYQSVHVLVQPAHRDEFEAALSELRSRLVAAAASVSALENAAAAATPERRAQLRRVASKVQEAREAVTSVA